MLDSINATGILAHWSATDIGDEVVLLFGTLLSALCLYSLIALGVRTMSGRRYKRTAQKRGKHAKRLAPFR